MNHKKLITLLAGITIGVTGLTTVTTNTSQTVQASKKDEIFMQGYETKHPYKYFKNWKEVVLSDKADFYEAPSNSTFKNVIFPKALKTLKANQVFKIKAVKGIWYVKGKQFPTLNGYQWYLPHIGGNDVVNDRWMTEDGYQSNYKFATTNSYAGISTLFSHKRKIKVTKNIRADRLKLTQPLANIYSVQHKTIKKGTVLTATGPTNHWNFKIWGKGLKNTSRYVWVANTKLSGWYKFLD